jgi:hypothetical protein
LGSSASPFLDDDAAVTEDDDEEKLTIEMALE